MSSAYHQVRADVSCHQVKVGCVVFCAVTRKAHVHLSHSQHIRLLASGGLWKIKSLWYSRSKLRYSLYWIVLFDCFKSIFKMYFECLKCRNSHSSNHYAGRKLQTSIPSFWSGIVKNIKWQCCTTIILMLTSQVLEKYMLN